MKNINNYINEQLSDNIHPKTKKELKQIIEKRIKQEGPKCDLNDIDISNVKDMSYLFYYSNFNGDISKWDVSHVIDMSGMFMDSKFNNDISNWNVSNVTNMGNMFAWSKFNKNIAKWDVSNVTNMINMFYKSLFNGNISDWNVNNVHECGAFCTGSPLKRKKNKQPKF